MLFPSRVAFRACAGSRPLQNNTSLNRGIGGALTKRVRVFNNAYGTLHTSSGAPLNEAAAAAIEPAKKRIIQAPFISGEGGIVLLDNVIGKLEVLSLDVGCDVFQDQVVATIETDKAAVDIKARENGTVLQVHVKVGDDIREGQQIATVMVD